MPKLKKKIFKPIKLLFFSASRAEYGMQKYFINFFKKDKRFKILFLTSGSHTSKLAVGDTSQQIKKDKIGVSKKFQIFLNSNTSKEAAKYSISLQKLFLKYISKSEPDYIFLSADRFETFAIAQIALLLKIPIIHLEGGDKTSGGALDDNIRHSLTKISSIHITTNKESFNRVLKLGEEKWRVFQVGYPTISNLKKKDLFSDRYVRRFLNNKANEKIIIFTLHPLIYEINKIKYVFSDLKKLLSLNYKIVFTYPNFDPGYKNIIKNINLFKNHKNVVIKKNLGDKLYLSLLNFLGKKKNGFLLGNSSSGIKESLFFKIPCINLGNRQKDRLKTKNIIDCDLKQNCVMKSVKKINKNFYKRMKNLNNIYKGNNGYQKIENVLIKNSKDKSRLLIKKISY